MVGTCWDEICNLLLLIIHLIRHGQAETLMVEIKIQTLTPLS